MLSPLAFNPYQGISIPATNSTTADASSVSTETTSGQSADQVILSSVNGKTSTATEKAAELSSARTQAYQQYYDAILSRVSSLLGSLTIGPVSTGDSGVAGLSSSVTGLQYGSFAADSTSILSGITSGESYSAEATAQRIFDFAISFFSDGDRTAYAEMAKDAVLKGFYEAQEEYGALLPAISTETINLVTSNLDAWSTGSSFSVTA